MPRSRLASPRGSQRGASGFPPCISCSAFAISSIVSKTDVRVLIAQRSLAPPGGGNAVAAWMVHALAPDHEVATITEREWSVEETNAFYGTSIPNGRITQHVSI